MTSSDEPSGPGEQIVMFASYLLPRPIVGEIPCANLVYPSRVGPVPVEVLIPERQAEDLELDTDDFRLHQERDAQREVRDTRVIVEDWSKGIAGPLDSNQNLAPDDLEAAKRPQFQIRRLLLKVLRAGEPLPPSRVGVPDDLAAAHGDQVFLWAERWLDIFYSWIEVHTAQDLNYMQPRWTAHVEGAGIATFQGNGTRLGLGGLVRLDNLWEIPSSPALLARATHRAGKDEYPAIAHLLLRNGRAAWHRKPYRRAAIDAGTALEIVLLQLATKKGVTSPKGPPPTLGRLVRVLKDQSVIPNSLAMQLQKTVVDSRNRAAHEGAEPEPAGVTQALQLSGSVVWRIDPLL